jgi:hypothetical protein
VVLPYDYLTSAYSDTNWKYGMQLMKLKWKLGKNSRNQQIH